jgi:hypothetical protein
MPAPTINTSVEEGSASVIAAAYRLRAGMQPARGIWLLFGKP